MCNRAAPETLLARIRARRYVDENAYTLGDLQRLTAAYDSWLSGWERCPVLQVDVDLRDLREPAEITTLAAEVRAVLRGRRSSDRSSRQC